MHEHCCSHQLKQEEGHAHHHDHEHHHDHHHAHGEEKEIDGILVSRHEEALIFSVSKDFLLPYKDALIAIGKKLEELSAWVNESGGFVGHIKGYVTDEAHSAMVSVTGDCCNITESTNAAVKLELTCIVFMVDEEKMCEKIRQAMQI